MIEFITPENRTESHSTAIQKAVDKAFETGVCSVILPQGEYNIETPVYLHENIHMHLDGAVLRSNDCIFKNSNVLKPRVFAKYGRQTGITVSGSNGARLSAKTGVYFYNAGDFDIHGIAFENCAESGITLVYSNHGRLSGFDFKNCKNGIEVLIGTRNCFIYNITGNCKDSFVFISSDDRDEMVYYNGPMVQNHIIRNIDGEAGNALIRIDGKNCRDIIVSDLKNKGSKAPAAFINDAENITLYNIDSLQKVKGNNYKKIYIK